MEEEESLESLEQEEIQEASGNYEIKMRTMCVINFPRSLPSLR